MKTATDKQIAEWKEAHGDIFLLTIEDGKQAYLKAPTMQDWRRAFNGLKRDGEIGYAEQLLTATWLAGDDEIKSSDENFLSVKRQLDQLMVYPDPIVERGEGFSTITVEGKVCKVKIISREHLKMAEAKNPESKPFATQEKLFEMVVLEADSEFNNRNDAKYRFPLYQALDELQSRKYAAIKKL